MVDTATIRTPPTYTGGSLRAEVRRPLTGAKARRVSANTLTMNPAAATPTSKLLANWGRIGAIRPKPRAMTKAAAIRTLISRGIVGVSGTGEGVLIKAPA